MRNKTGTAAGRVLSEMYRAREVGKKPGPFAPSREPPLEDVNDEAGPRALREPDQAQDP